MQDGHNFQTRPYFSMNLFKLYLYVKFVYNDINIPCKRLLITTSNNYTQSWVHKLIFYNIFILSLECTILFSYLKGKYISEEIMPKYISIM